MGYAQVSEYTVYANEVAGVESEAWVYGYTLWVRLADNHYWTIRDAVGKYLTPNGEWIDMRLHRLATQVPPACYYPTSELALRHAERAVEHLTMFDQTCDEYTAGLTTNNKKRNNP